MMYKPIADPIAQSPAASSKKAPGVSFGIDIGMEKYK